MLRARVQGSRPVILVGTSLGCATILTALLELAKDPANANLVSDVFLIVSVSVACSLVRS